MPSSYIMTMLRRLLLLTMLICVPAGADERALLKAARLPGPQALSALAAAASTPQQLQQLARQVTHIAEAEALEQVALHHGILAWQTPLPEPEGPLRALPQRAVGVDFVHMPAWAGNPGHVAITRVWPGTPAWGNLQPGDQIIACGETPLENMDIPGLQQQWHQALNASEGCTVTVLREKERVVLTLATMDLARLQAVWLPDGTLGDPPGLAEALAPWLEALN